MGTKNVFWAFLEDSGEAPPPPATATIESFDSTFNPLGPTIHNLTSVPAGSLLVLTTTTETDSSNCSVSSTPNLTWTKRVDAQGGSSGNAEIYTARFITGGDITVISDWNSSQYAQASVLYVVSGSNETTGGVTGVANNQSQPSVSVTTTRANSILFCCTSDWNAIDGISRTYRSSATERLYYRLGGAYTTYHYIRQTPSIGSYQMGLTAPSGQSSGTCVLEIRSDSGPDITPPSAPTLSSPSQSSSSISLSWTTATDNIGVTGYEIYVDSVLEDTTTATTYNVTGLSPSTSYSIYVRAKDAAGNGTNSNTITPSTGSGAGVNEFSMTIIPTTEPDFFYTPGRGAEEWSGQNLVNIPVQGINTPRNDAYFRFSWSMLEGATQNNYTFNNFNTRINQAIDNGQKFSFGIMTHYPDAVSPHRVNYSGGGYGVYPQYLHDLMQAEPVKDWQASNGSWVPNWNSESYLSRLEALHQALNTHIMNTSYNGVNYRDIINYIDIRGYGAYGEWHLYTIVDNAGTLPSEGDHPTGTRATTNTLIRIIDAHVDYFPDFPLVMLISAYDCNRLNNTKNPPEVCYHALTVENNWGKVGWRRDNWGATDSYINLYLAGNNINFNGSSGTINFADEIVNRYQFVPIVGEPCCNANYNSLQSQIVQYGAVSFGNGNVSPNDTIRANFRAASKAAGFRYVINGGEATATVAHDETLSITINWQNLGVSPTYEDWTVLYELKDNSDLVVWSAASTKVMKLFLPAGSGSDHVDNYVIPNTVTPGTYTLTLKVIDDDGFRDPMPLYIEGVNGDGSYDLTTVEITT